MTDVKVTSILGRCGKKYHAGRGENDRYKGELNVSQWTAIARHYRIRTFTGPLILDIDETSHLTAKSEPLKKFDISA